MNTIKTIAIGLLSMLAVSGVYGQKVKVKTKDGVPVVKIKDEKTAKVKVENDFTAYSEPKVKVKPEHGYAVAKVKHERHYYETPKVKHKNKDGYAVVKTKNYSGYKTKNHYYSTGCGCYYHVSNGHRIYHHHGWKP